MIFGCVVLCGGKYGDSPCSPENSSSEMQRKTAVIAIGLASATDVHKCPPQSPVRLDQFIDDVTQLRLAYI